MPFSLMLVGYEVAKPVLNALAIFSGLYVFLGNRQKVNLKELRKIVIFMLIGTACGIFINTVFQDQKDILYTALGVFVIYLAITGLFFKAKDDKPIGKSGNVLLVLAGIAHGIFVSGGPLVIGYLSRVIKDKVEFRATISSLWVIMNSIILFDDIRVGYWNKDLLIMFLITIPFLFVGMKIGTALYHRMSQQLFIKITYILLLISGVTLIL